MNIRHIIIARLEEENRSRNWLAQHAGITASVSTVFGFLRGDHDVGSVTVGEIFDVIGLGVGVDITGDNS